MHKVYWGSHGCGLAFGHTGPCECECGEKLPASHPFVFGEHLDTAVRVLPFNPYPPIVRATTGMFLHPYPPITVEALFDLKGRIVGFEIRTRVMCRSDVLRACPWHGRL